MYNDPIYDEKNEVKKKVIKFGKVGDSFKGTLLGKKLVEVRTDKGPVKKYVYEFQAHGGSFHDSSKDNPLIPVEEETAVESGEYCSLWSRGQIFDDDMRRAKPGMIVAYRFTGTNPAKPGKQAAKIVKIYIGGVDPNYMGENAEDVVAAAGFTEPAQPPM